MVVLISKPAAAYVIWKEFAGKQVSHAMLKSLLVQGKTQVLSFKTRTADV